jgi:hypothetical protein
VTRACSIPQFKALFFPVMNLWDVNVTNQTVAEIRAEVAPCIDATTTLSVELSGKPVSKPGERRADEGPRQVERLPLGTHRVDIISSRSGCLFVPTSQSVQATYIHSDGGAGLAGIARHIENRPALRSVPRRPRGARGCSWSRSDLQTIPIRAPRRRRPNTKA